MSSGDNTLNTTDILNNYGGTINNNLININNLNDDNSILQINESRYYDIEGLKHFLSCHKDELFILSLNIQSIRSKFPQLQMILFELARDSYTPDLICLQETWLPDEDNINLFYLDGYHLINKNYEENCSKHGGLLTYVKNSFKIETTKIIENNKTFEGLVVDIMINNRKISVLNIYRPPINKNRTFDNFFLEYIPQLSNITNIKKELIICGDFNINLLQLQNNVNYAKFYDHMLNLQYASLITFPTRFSETSASVIDHIYYKMTSSMQTAKTGIILSNLSDHCPTFLSVNIRNTVKPKCPKFIKTVSFTEETEEKFKSALQSIHFDAILNKDIHQDPNINYDIIKDIFQNLLVKHFPEKTIKFNRYKHKLNNWMIPY